jgi:hypothetical protein
MTHRKTGTAFRGAAICRESRCNPIMRDKSPKVTKKQQIVARDTECRLRIDYLSTLPDEQLNKLIDKSLF